MKEAMGGTWLTGLVIVFIFLFAGFLAYSISYTKAFRVKNEILNLIERNEGFTTSANDLNNITDDALKSDPSVEGKAFAYIKAMGYNYSVFDGTNDPCARNNNCGYAPQRSFRLYSAALAISLSAVRWCSRQPLSFFPGHPCQSGKAEDNTSGGRNARLVSIYC